jgi:ribosomal protein L31E
MARTSRATALQVAQAAFEGLAPLLIECGVTSPEAEALLRAVCVHSAATAQGIERRRPNVSRISVKTGVDRHAVTQLLQVPADVDVALSSRRDAVSRVLDGWLSDTEYTEKGAPRDLDIGDPSSNGRSVWTLVERYAPGVWPRLIVDELIEMDHVITLPNGQLRWKRKPSLKRLSRRVKRQSAGPPMRDAFRALFDSTRSDTACIWRTAQGLEIAERDLPLVRKMLRDRFDSMFAWITDELNSARWRRDISNVGGRVRVGLAGFTFEEHLPKDVGSEKVRKGRRSKR